MSNWYLVSFPSRFFEGGICTANFKTKKQADKYCAEVVREKLTEGTDSMIKENIKVRFGNSKTGYSDVTAWFKEKFDKIKIKA
jgi:hypothetical protein